MTMFPLRFRLAYIPSSDERMYQAEGMMGTKPVVYVPAPESKIQPSEMGTLFLVSWARTLEEYPEYNIVGVNLEYELRPLEEIKEDYLYTPTDVKRTIRSVLAPHPVRRTVRQNHHAQERSRKACSKRGNKTTC